MSEQFIYLGGTKIQEGTGSPEASVVSQKGSVYLRKDGGTGTTLYVKETGTGNTGWSAVGSSAFDPAVATDITFTGGQGVITGDSDPLFINGVKINGGTDGSYGGSILIQGGGGVGLRGVGPYGGSRLDISGCDLINGHTQNNVLYCRNADSGNNDGAGFIIQLGDKSGSGVSGSFLVRDNLAVDLFRIAYDGTITGPDGSTFNINAFTPTSSNGNNLTLRATAATSVNGDGGEVKLYSGNATGAGDFIGGGVISMNAGNGGNTSVGGSVIRKTGDGGSTSGPSGSFTDTVGSTVDGNVGSWSVIMPNATGANRSGGVASFQLGAKTGSGTDGYFLIKDASSNNLFKVNYDGSITAGVITFSDGLGHTQIYGPTDNDLRLDSRNGANVVLHSDGTGWAVLSSGPGGDARITTDDHSSSTGNILIQTGVATGGDSGSILLETQTSVGGNANGGVIAAKLANKTGSGVAGYFLIKDAASVDLFKVNYSGVIQIQNGPTLQSGTGTPEGAVTATVGSIFIRTDGGAGTSVYFKESGAGNTGWVGK